MKSLRNLIGAVICAAFFVYSTQAATNVWTQISAGNASGSWNIPGNPPWDQGFIPGAGDTANFSTLDITANSIITLDADQTIDQMIFGDTNTATAASWLFKTNTAPPYA